MFVLDKMKLNRFELRPIVSARALVASKGNCPSTESSKADSSCFNAPSVDGATKTKLLGLVDEMARVAYAKRESDGQSSSMTPINAEDK